MGWRTKYDIAFKGLKEGLHEFEYEIGDTFFEHFEQDMVNAGKVNVKAGLERRNTFMKLLFTIDGWVELTCDRCLEKYLQKVDSQAEVFVKFSESVQEDDDQVIWISPEEYRINLAQLIYEYIFLSLPLKHVHPDKKNGESGCNQKMIQKLENHKPHTDNNEDENHPIDPRWEVLKKLKNNN